MFTRLRHRLQWLATLQFLSRRMRMLVAVIATLALLGYSCLWLMIGTYARNALAHPPARKADAALILGARAYLHGVPNPCLVGRVEAGLALARQGLVSTLVMSGGGDREDGRIEAETMRQIAVDRGFKGRILLETQSRSTQENFSLSRQLLQSSGISSVIVVTEPYHLWRAQRLVQASAFGSAFDVSFKAAPSQCWQTWGMFYKGSLREPLAIINNYAKGYLNAAD